MGKTKAVGRLNKLHFKFYYRNIVIKKHGTGAKTDIQINGMELMTQIHVHLTRMT